MIADPEFPLSKDLKSIFDGEISGGLFVLGQPPTPCRPHHHHVLCYLGRLSSVITNFKTDDHVKNLLKIILLLDASGVKIQRI